MDKTIIFSTAASFFLAFIIPFPPVTAFFFPLGAMDNTIIFSTAASFFLAFIIPFPPLLSKLVHCVENTNIPTLWVDWDEREGTLEEHKERHGQVLKEMYTMMGIRAFFNAVMLAPIVYTATNIWERHRLLKSTIGAMNMEQVSYDNVTLLFYCVVVVFPILVVLEFLLYSLYQNKFHPWVEILNDDVVEDYDVEEYDQDPDNE